MKQLRKMSEGLDLLNKQFSNVAAFKSIGEQAAEPGSALRLESIGQEAARAFRCVWAIGSR